MVYMESIGVRELRQNASRYLDRVAAGEAILVTDRGVAKSVLIPPPSGTLFEQLVASGELLPGRGGDFPPPLPARPGFSASAELQRLRDEERW